MKKLDIIKPIKGSHKHLALAVAVASGLLAGTALAAPANDNFASAIDLTGVEAGQTGDVNTGDQTGTNTSLATLEVGEPLPGATEVNTVWFKWTCPADGNFTYGTLGSTDTVAAEWDAIIGIYTGAAVNTLTPLGTTPKDTGANETMTIAVTSGTTYYIQLAGWNNTEAANILLNWSYAAPPKTVLWNVAGGGDWDLATSNWYTQPSGPVSTFANGDNAIFNNPAGGTINIPSTVSFGTTTVGAASGNYTISGSPLGGTGSLTMGGSGTLTLGSTNSYSGATVVNTGTLVATGNGAIGSSASFTVATGAILQLNGTNAAEYKWPAAAATLTGAGTVNIPLGNYLNIGSNFNMSAFTGTLNLTSANGQFSANPYFSPGFTAPPNGTINIGNNTTLYLGWQGTTFTTTIQLSGGTDNGEGLGVLRGDNATLNGAVILATNSKIGSAGGTLTINSVIGDGGNGFGFTTVGYAGTTVILTAVTNTYTGPTIVNIGTTLQCDTPGSLGGGALSINGKVNLNHGGNRNVTSLHLAGTPKAAGVYGSSASVAPPANQDNARFAGTGTVTVVPPVVQKTVLWNVAGGGDWNLATSNWLTQPSNVVSNFANGDDAIFNNPAGGTINIPSTVSALSTTVSSASGNYTFSGAALGGTGSLTMNGLGSLTLASTNSYSGATVVNSGTLVANGNSAVGGSTNFSVAAGAILQLNGTNAVNYKWPLESGSLTGAGTVNLPLNGNAGVGTKLNMSTFTGNLNIAGGMFGVNTVHSPGFTAPASGTINVGNATTLYLGWTGFVLNTTVRLNGSTDNGEGLGVLRASNGTLNGALILGTNTTIGADPTLIINAVISDGGNGFGFTTVASGTVTLTAANTYTGPTTVNGGTTLKCDIPNALGSGALSINGKVNLNFVGNKTVASLTLAGTPKAAGVYGSSASAAPPANQDDARFAGTGTVTIGSNYDIWAAVYLPTDVSDPAGDNDGDGLSNQEEYAFGLNPTLGTSVNPITVPLNKTTGMFTYTRRATPAATGLTYTVQTSTDLAIWPTDVTATQNVTGTVGDVQTVDVTVTGAPLTAPSIFVRIKAAP